MMFPPEYSPWGEVQHLEELCSGVFAVATASHGGIMVHRSIARTVLSPAARKHGFPDATTIASRRTATPRLPSGSCWTKVSIRLP